MRMTHAGAPEVGRAGLALALAFGLLALGGCAAPDDGEVAAEWEEPGWMAQVRQQDEAYQSAMIACFAEYGLEGTRQIGGGVGFHFTTDDGSIPEIPPGVQEIIDAASEDCNARVSPPDHWSSVLDEASYERLIDLRECIVAQGYDVPEPPSAQVWIDSGLEAAFNPYAVLLDGSSGFRIPEDELRSLMEACPQSGPNFYAVAPTDGDG